MCIQRIMEFVQCNVTVLCFRNFTSYVCFKPAISLHKYCFICINEGIKHFYGKHSNSLTSTHSISIVRTTIFSSALIKMFYCIITLPLNYRLHIDRLKTMLPY